MDQLKPAERATLALDLAHRFTRSGHEFYLVGGPVRDVLLGIELRDLDFATSALPDDTYAVLQSVPDAHPFRVGEKFGTIGARIGEQEVQITTYRTGERYSVGSRKPTVRFGTTLDEDLTRRDFTINAMALNPLDGTIVDPLGGEADLRAGVVRAVGDPARRFDEDPLRLLRGVRFASRFDFVIDAGTWTAMTESATSLERISRERIRDEYSSMLVQDVPSRALTLLRDSGLLAHSVPQILELDRMTDHGPRHPLSLWEHEMRVIDKVRPDRVVRWAALLHDIAKPATRTIEPGGRPRFFHHEEVGAAMARDILTGLRYPQSVVDAVALLVDVHMQLHAYSPEWSDGAVRRLCIRLGDRLGDAIALVRADAAGHSNGAEPYNSPKFDHLEARIEALGHPVAPLSSPLSGDDLMRHFSRPPGPWIGEIKDALEDEVVEGRLEPNDREAAWIIAERLAGLQNAG
jgi:poly(A) polymerase